MSNVQCIRIYFVDQDLDVHCNVLFTWFYAENTFTDE